MKISLEKGSKLSLKKDVGNKDITQFVMGLGWDTFVVRKVGKGKKVGKGFFSRLVSKSSEVDEEVNEEVKKIPAKVDIDASCVVIGKDKTIKETIFFRHLKSKNGAIRHHGDNLTGEGDGDDEQITVKLDLLDDDVQQVIFTVNIFSNDYTFNNVSNAFCRICDSRGHEVVRMSLDSTGSHNALIAARLVRTEDDWVVESVQRECNGSTVKSIEGDVLDVAQMGV